MTRFLYLFLFMAFTLNTSFTIANTPDLHPKTPPQDQPKPAAQANDQADPTPVPDTQSKPLDPKAEPKSQAAEQAAQAKDIELKATSKEAQAQEMSERRSESRRHLEPGIHQLRMMVNEQTKLIAVLSKELDTRRRCQLEVNNENIKLSRRFAELESKAEARKPAEPTCKKCQHAADQKAAEKPKKAPAEKASPLHSKVTAIQKNVKLLVTIDAGTNDGLKPGVTCIIHDGTNFRGQATIHSVTAETAQCIVIFKKLKIEIGNRVMFLDPETDKK